MTQSNASGCIASTIMRLEHQTNSLNGSLRHFAHSEARFALPKTPDAHSDIACVRK